MLTPLNYKPKHKPTALHILGTAYSIPGDNRYPTEPFTNKALFFSKAFTDLGFPVYYYGVEGGEENVTCTKYIPVVSQKSFFETYPTPEDTRKDHFSSAVGKAWEDFEKNSIKEVKKNIVNPQTDMIFSFFGHPHRPVTDASKLITIEPGIGHPGSYANFRIFESYAWQNFTYGKEGRDATDKWPHSYDHVIPPSFYPDLYEFSDQKEDYLMFMGRVNWGKGISLAVELSNYFNIKLIIAGSGDLKSAIPPEMSTDHVEYVGVLGAEQKVKYLSKAKAFVCPSQYIEPFGHVVAEASLCGAPIITTDFGAFSENVIHGETGYRCKVYSDFINAVDNISNIKPLVCRQSAIDRYSIHNIIPQYLKYFNDILTLYVDERGWYAVN